MNSLTLLCYADFATCSLFVLTQATVGGQYSVNVHFVPPLVTAACPIAQFWSPPNVTCGMHFCMTGMLSRCIPQPGCNPNNPNNATTTTTTTTPAPAMGGGGGDGGSGPVNPGDPGAGTDQGAGAAKPPAEMGEASESSMSESSSSSDAAAAGGGGDDASAGSNGVVKKTRNAKPAKIKRRRNV